jgi:PTS system nitrogen regulatory IIA component
MTESESILSCKVCGLKSREKYQALHELIYSNNTFSCFEDRRVLEKDVFAREKLQSTGLGRGVAVAHGKTVSAKGVFIALGISRTGINYDAPDRLPVQLLFLIANPPEETSKYLKLLSSVVSLSRCDDFRAMLLCCCDAEAAEKKLQDSLLKTAAAV